MITASSTVGILSENRALVIDAGMAASKLGANVVYLNAGFSAAQAREVAQREGVNLVITDEPQPRPKGRTSLKTLGRTEVQGVQARLDGSPVTPPPRPGRVVILTSGTTGLPRVRVATLTHAHSTPRASSRASRSSAATRRSSPPRCSTASDCSTPTWPSRSGRR